MTLEIPAAGHNPALPDTQAKPMLGDVNLGALYPASLPYIPDNFGATDTKDRDAVVNLVPIAEPLA